MVSLISQSNRLWQLRGAFLAARCLAINTTGSDSIESKVNDHLCQRDDHQADDGIKDSILGRFGAFGVTGASDIAEATDNYHDDGRSTGDYGYNIDYFFNRLG